MGGGGHWSVTQLTHDVQEIFGEDLRPLVNRLARTVEHPTEHVLGHWSPKNVAGKLASRVTRINPRGSLEHLSDTESRVSCAIGDKPYKVHTQIFHGKKGERLNSGREPIVARAPGFQ